MFGKSCSVCRLWPAILLKRDCFPVNFAKILRTPFLRNTSRRLLLKIKITDELWKESAATEDQ